jgi:hypothetical protein
VNLYGFVGNRSTVYVDRLGLDPYISNSLSVNERFTWTQKNAEADPFTPNALAKFDLKREITSEGCQLIVTVKIKFAGGANRVGQNQGNEDKDGYVGLSDDEAKEMLDEFNQGIEDAWNNRFQICCDEIDATQSRVGKKSRRNTFTKPEHCCCDVVVRIEPNDKGSRVGVFSNPKDGSDQYN